MFRRRKPVDQDGDESDRPEDGEDALDATGDAGDDPAGAATGSTGRAGGTSGPRDAAEVDLEAEADRRVDLGSLHVAPREGLDLQLQVDEASGQVVAVLLAGTEGAVELRAFAAPRHASIWDGIRKQVAAEAARLGGTATEEEGAYGTELRLVLPVTLDDGQRVQQISRVVGFDGPRWLVRATLFGRPAVEHRPDGDIEQALADVVVVRGGSPFPPGDVLPLTVPPNAQRVDPGE